MKPYPFSAIVGHDQLRLALSPPTMSSVAKSKNERPPARRRPPNARA